MRTPRTALVAVVLGVVLGLVLGLVLGAVLSGCTGVEAPRWEPYETSVATPPAIAEQCPDAGTPLPYPGGGELPSGAVAVRLCNGPDPTGGADAGLLFDPPADLLETGVEDLVSLVNGLDPVDLETQACDGNLGPTSVCWFLYDDGSARAASLQHYGCHNTYVAPDQAGAGGQMLISTFDRRLEEQRADREPPGDARVPSCSRDSLTPVSPLPLTGDDVRLATAVYCTDQGRAVLTPRQVARLSADLRDQPPPRITCERASLGVDATIAGRTDWGDAVVLRGRCFTYRAPIGLIRDTTPEEEERQPWWVLSPVVRRMLTALPLR